MFQFQLLWWNGKNLAARKSMSSKERPIVSTLRCTVCMCIVYRTPWHRHTHPDWCGVSGWNLRYWQTWHWCTGSRVPPGRTVSLLVWLESVSSWIMKAPMPLCSLHVMPSCTAPAQKPQRSPDTICSLMLTYAGARTSLWGPYTLYCGLKLEPAKAA